MVPAVYSIKHWKLPERLSPSSCAICRSSFRFSLAKSQSVRQHARNTCCSMILQHSVLRHSMRLFALPIDSATFSGVSKLPERSSAMDFVNIKGGELTIEHAPPFLKELFSFTAVMRVLSAKRDRTEKIAQRVKIMLG